MKALLLVGSYRSKGASWRLGTALLEALDAAGFTTETANLVHSLGEPEAWSRLEAAVAAAELLVLSCPVYIDTLPAPTTAALIRLADRVGGKGLVVILNCGFPEVYHNAAALEVCRQFARESDCRWLGRLALSMGGFAPGGGVSAPVRWALRLAAGALARGRPVPGLAVRLAAVRPMPGWLYRLVLNRQFRRVNQQHGRAPIDARPYWPE